MHIKLVFKVFFVKAKCRVVFRKAVAQNAESCSEEFLQLYQVKVQ